MINDTYHLFVSNATTSDRHELPIFRALSTDGVRFSIQERAVTPSGVYEHEGGIVMWRDPFVVWHHNRWYMFITASLIQTTASARSRHCFPGTTVNSDVREHICVYQQKRGCVAMATAATMSSQWALQLPAANLRVQHPSFHLSDGSRWLEMERPQVYFTWVQLG